MSYSLAFRDSRRSETQINALHPFFQPPLHIYTEFWYETVESWRSPISQSDLIIIDKVIIKRSKRRAEVVDAPLRSHTLPDSATQMWLFVNDWQELSNF